MTAKRAKPPLTPEQRELDRARKRATRLLAATDRSRAELEQRLANAGFSASAVARVLEEFTKAKLIDDRKLAARLVERELERAPADRPLLRARLERKGVEEDLTDEVVEAAIGPRDLLADAKAAVRKRLAGMLDARRIAPSRLVGRLLGYLSRRGFDQETAESATEAVLRPMGLWPDESAAPDPDE